MPPFARNVFRPLNENAGTPGAGELTLTVTSQVPSSLSPAVLAAGSTPEMASMSPAAVMRRLILTTFMMVFNGFSLSVKNHQRKSKLQYVTFGYSGEEPKSRWKRYVGVVAGFSVVGFNDARGTPGSVVALPFSYPCGALKARK